MVDLNYDLSSLCGPVDMRVVHFIEKYRGNQFDPSYLTHIQKWHGGIPGKQYFDAEDGKTYRVGRFLTLVDEKTKLEPPARPSWEYRERDIRIDWSVLTRIDEEGACRQVFSGEKLLPFANLFYRDIHPDEMGIGEDGVVDLLAFIYEGKSRPRVVVNLARKSLDENFRLQKVRSEEWEVRYDDITVPVAANFDDFLKLLRAKP
jgi:hypothetical protein